MMKKSTNFSDFVDAYAYIGRMCKQSVDKKKKNGTENATNDQNNNAVGKHRRGESATRD